MTLKEQQNAWAFAWRDHKDERAFDRLVESLEGMIQMTIRRHAGAHRLPREDLYQEALLGIMTACRRFDPEQGPFSACVRALRHP